MVKNLWLFFFCCLLFVSCKRNEPDVCLGACKPIEFFVIDEQAMYNYAGTEIVYIHYDKEPSKAGIYLINVDGSGNRLFHQGVGISSPSFSPDGKWIVFSQNAQLYKKTVSGDMQVAVTTQGRNFYPCWSPDGEWIAYDSNYQSPNGMNFIWKISQIDLSQHRIAYDLSNGEIRMPAWGRNDKIVHIRYVSSGTAKQEIFIMDPDGGNIKRLTNNDDFETYPQCSVNGKIVYDFQPNATYPSIWIMDIDGANKKKLINTPSTHASWSPDGQHIVFTDARTGNGRLWIVDSQGKNPKQLTSDTNFKQ